MNANSDPVTAAACSTVLKRVLRQHPNTAGKTSTMNLPGAQERAIIACISQVSCHSANFISPLHDKTQKSYTIQNKLDKKKNYRKCIWCDYSSTHLANFLKMEQNGRLSTAIFN